jgi:predicted GNAT family acetyltransferase
MTDAARAHTPLAAVADNVGTTRFELTSDGQTAFLLYKKTPETLELIHTEVPDALRGRDLGNALVEYALDKARAWQLRVVAICPFVRTYLRKRADRESDSHHDL